MNKDLENSQNQSKTSSGSTPTSQVAVSKPVVSNNVATNTSVAGFPAAVIKLLRDAQKINKLSIICIVLAIFAFIVFGTLASLKMFHGSRELYLLFHYLPYILVGLTIPFTLYQAFLVYRYRLSQPSMLVTSVGGASLMLVVCLLFSLADWLWIAMAAWIGVAYWFQATFKRFFNFIEIKKIEAKRIKTSQNNETKPEPELET